MINDVLYRRVCKALVALSVRVYVGILPIVSVNASIVVFVLIQMALVKSCEYVARFSTRLAHSNRASLARARRSTHSLSGTYAGSSLV